VCTNAGGCGYCAAEGRCVPKDAHGPYPGTCAADFSAERCPAAVYFARDEAKIHARMRDLLRGMEPAGPPIDTKVDGASPSRTVHIPVTRGFCYGLAARESYDLTWVEVEAAANAPYVEDGGDWVAVYQRSAVLTPFCPQSSGSIVVRIKLDTGAPRAVAGTYRVQLFRSPIADAELRARADKVEAQQRRERVRYVCGHCAKVVLACRLDGQPRCAEAYAGCLANGGVGADACERGDVAPPKPKPPWET
jgi:hypothetical protein